MLFSVSANHCTTALPSIKGINGLKSENDSNIYAHSSFAQVLHMVETGAEFFGSHEKFRTIFSRVLEHIIHIRSAHSLYTNLFCSCFMNEVQYVWVPSSASYMTTCFHVFYVAESRDISWMNSETSPVEFSQIGFNQMQQHMPKPTQAKWRRGIICNGHLLMHSSLKVPLQHFNCNVSPTIQYHPPPPAWLYMAVHLQLRKPETNNGIHWMATLVETSCYCCIWGIYKIL